ncbi:MAG TPA: hypothetical protein PLU39_17585 [Armatimonadota bacterium]|jgi:hypothetical protein|nr:hypothetical protein [Armatimonadota bacterium]HOM82536.1 hypothetical protein [Armatimonadota bacterium]HOQ27291.1 hypothetical protein [Armatimonadota bacterium]HPO72618.1 hypothetical protein [Armatimonadota bacterium]HPT99678.1 hypothetical protein [Armatimonadota bacterium]
MKRIVDTNVIVVTNGRSEQVSPACVMECARQLKAITGGACTLVLDDAFHILREYRSNCSESGQPGLGDAFLKWVLTNWRDPRRCECVHITQLGDDNTAFSEFPDDDSLAGFDPSDRKFVAVALAHPERPPILQAADAKWWTYRDALRAFGVEVLFLCGPDAAAFTGGA